MSDAYDAVFNRLKVMVSQDLLREKYAAERYAALALRERSRSYRRAIKAALRDFSPSQYGAAFPDSQQPPPDDAGGQPPR